MGLFGNTNIIPDDVAEKVATSLFNKFNQSLEYHIDEDIKRFNLLEEWKMKPFWHYGSGDEHYKFSVDKQITEEMDFYRTFIKGNGYISCDRFNCIHTVNRESFIKVLDLVKKKFAALNKQFIYTIYYDKVYKKECFKPYAYITLEQKLATRGDGKGHTPWCNRPKPDYRPYILWRAPYQIVQNRPDLQVNVELRGITLLSEKELMACKQFINFQLKERSWWLRDAVPGLLYPKIMQPNELVYPTSVEAEYCISPAVTGDFRGFKRGDKVLFAGYKWTVIFENMILIDAAIGVGPFNYFHSDKSLYETSRIRDFIEHWFEQHRNDPMYRASR